MDYLQEIEDYWAADDVVKAVELKEKCVTEGMLNEDEVNKLKHVPTTIVEYYCGMAVDPAPRDVGRCGRYIIGLAIKLWGRSKKDIMEASGLELAEFRLAQAGRLTKMSTYKKLLTGIMALLPPKGEQIRI